MFRFHLLVAVATAIVRGHDPRRASELVEDRAEGIVLLQTSARTREESAERAFLKRQQHQDQLVWTAPWPTPASEPVEPELVANPVDVSDRMPHFGPQDNAIQVVVISDRSEALLGSIGSLMLYTHTPTVVSVISRNENLQQELMSLLQNSLSPFIEVRFISFTSVLSDMKSQGLVPVWQWPGFASSLTNSEAWLTNNTVRVDKWDNLTVHSNPMNLLRFYLPELKQFRELPWLMFMDDDILVKGNLANLRDIKLKSGKVQLATCGLWKWGGGRAGKCESFGLSSRTPLAETDFMYMNGHATTEQSPQYLSALNAAIRDLNGIKEPDLYSVDYWNYGFVKLDLIEWRSGHYTQLFERWMRRNAEDHIFPEYSLSFGLGISQLMLMGKVECWDEVNISISDGLGYVTDEDFVRSNLSLSTLDSSFVLHWSGTDKPFVSTPPQSFRYQWNNVLSALGAPEVQDMKLPETRQKALLVTDTPSGAEWFMDLLDQHPRLCAPNGGLGAFPRESLITGDLNNLGIDYCSRAVSCTWSFVSQWVPVFYQYRSEYCNSNSELALWLIQFPNAANVYRFNRHRLCLWVAHFHENNVPMLPQTLFNAYVDIAFSEKSREMLGCSCPVTKDVQVLKFLSDWWLGDQQKSEKFDFRIFDTPASDLVDTNLSLEMRVKKYQDFRVQDGYLNRLKSPELEIDFSKFAVVSLSRENVFESYVMAQVGQKVGNNPQDTEKRVHIRLDHMLHYIEDAVRLRQSFFQTLQSRSNVLHLTYEECVIDPRSCVQRVQAYLNVTEKEALLSEEDLALKDEDVMQYVINGNEVRETLIEYGFGRWLKAPGTTFLAAPAEGANQLQFLVPSLELAYKPIDEAEKPSYWWDGSSDRLVFLHIHRTGGSTLTQLLGGSEFATVNVSGLLIPRHKLKDSVPCLPDATCKIQNFAADVMDGLGRESCWNEWPGATAHFIQRFRELKETNCRLVELHHFDMSATMPFVRNGYKVITIVREPISHLMSRFEYELLRRWNWTGQLAGESYEKTFDRFERWTGFQTAPQEALRYFTGCTNARIPDPLFDVIEEKIESQSVGLCRYEYLDGYTKFDTVLSTASSMIPIALKTARDQIGTLLLFEAWNPSLELVSRKHRVPLENEALHLNSVQYKYDFKMLPVESQRRLHARLLPDTIFYNLMTKKFIDDADANEVDLSSWYAACRCSQYRLPATKGSPVCEHKTIEASDMCMPTRSDGTCELDQLRCIDKSYLEDTKTPSLGESLAMHFEAFWRGIHGVFQAFQNLKAFIADPLGVSRSLSAIPNTHPAQYEYMALNNTYCGGSRTRTVASPGPWTLEQALSACDALDGCLCVMTYQAEGSTSGWELAVFEEPTVPHQEEMDALLWSGTADVRCDGAQSWLAGDVRCFLRENSHWFTFMKSYSHGF